MKSLLNYSSSFFFYSLILISLLTLCSVSAKAFTMSNNNWIIRMGNLNSGGGKPTGGDYKLGVTIGETGKGFYANGNYRIRAGFQYIHSIISFSFTISDLVLDFGTLTPTNPVKRTNTLTVSNGSAYGYNVTAYEDHELLNPPSGQLIPDTTCDSGTCTEVTSSLWPDSSLLTYGFGYRCDNLSGTDCLTFPVDHYKQFANFSKNETPQAVMQSNNVGRDRQAQITYKINVSGAQAAGKYSNLITYIATPSF